MPEKKNLGNLVEDIHSVFVDGHEVNEEYLELFAENCKEILRRVVSEVDSDEDPTLRMSILGTPDRKLWYNFKYPKETQRSISPELRINFAYGHILEEFLLFLIRQAGHEVTHEQHEVEVDGVLGHLDCCIDGVPTDIKSASQYGFKKFADGTLLQGDDPFGYVHQISGYANAMGKDEAAFVAINKNKGDIAVLKVDDFFIENTEERIKNVRSVLSSEVPPKRCYGDEPDGEGGNRKLTMPCVFCPHKFKCWDGLRVFQYSNGPRYLTRVSNTPRVPEVTHGYKDALK